jgi:hypothetical protein
MNEITVIENRFASGKKFSMNEILSKIELSSSEDFPGHDFSSRRIY